MRTIDWYTQIRYYPAVAILGFAHEEIEQFFADGTVPRRAGWSEVTRVVARKLDMIDFAHALTDLRSPPGNRLEALRGDLTGFHSIRVNERWRIVFRWTEHGAEAVDVVDYH